ncbi:hypothetical protein THSYN_20905 [Candidatus Thiodictyon syntrophicum]|uniref:Uncharacterized protein n=1 Tax=Candidatus Thiodictyon syntrophicum TaxID=1166950 RepID=A0A2K8UCC8_9GAMM|nr:hypothetical protein THSYN_20905 [Candidatus Thiodictyon syntrophicum]
MLPGTAGRGDRRHPQGGAIKAYNAWLIAKNEIASQHWEDLDRVIAAMAEAGRAMPARLREMGTGGLGVTLVEC